MRSPPLLVVEQSLAPADDDDRRMGFRLEKLQSLLVLAHFISHKTAWADSTAPCTVP